MHAVPVSNGLLRATLKMLDLTLKRSLGAAEQDRPGVTKRAQNGRKGSPLRRQASLWCASRNAQSNFP
jgi:hypothetical protein